MIYLYIVGLLVALLNVSLATRLTSHSTFGNKVILVVGIALFPLYDSTFTEISTDQYTEIQKISQEIKGQAAAKDIQTLLTESMDDKSISLKEYRKVKKAYNQHFNKNGEKT